MENPTIKSRVSNSIIKSSNSHNTGAFTNNQALMIRHIQRQSYVSYAQARVYASFILGGVDNG